MDLQVQSKRQPWKTGFSFQFKFETNQTNKQAGISTHRQFAHYPASDILYWERRASDFKNIVNHASCRNGKLSAASLPVSQLCIPSSYHLLFVCTKLSIRHLYGEPFLHNFQRETKVPWCIKRGPCKSGTKVQTQQSECHRNDKCRRLCRNDMQKEEEVAEQWRRKLHCQAQ